MILYQDEIEAIAWDEYSTAYGPATAVGQHLLGVQAEDSQTVDNSFSFLASNILHQGDIHSAVIPAFPLLLRILDNDNLLCRNRLIYLLGLMFKALCEDEPTFDASSLRLPTQRFLDTSLNRSDWQPASSLCFVPFLECYAIKFLSSTDAFVHDFVNLQQERLHRELDEISRCSIICSTETLAPDRSDFLHDLVVTDNERNVRVLMQLLNTAPTQQVARAAGGLLRRQESEFAFFDNQILMDYGRECFFPWIRRKFQIALLSVCLRDDLVQLPEIEDALVHLMAISSRRRATFAKLILEYLVPQRTPSLSGDSPRVLRRVLQAFVDNASIWEKDGQLAGTLQRMIGVEGSLAGRELLESLMKK